MVKILTDTRAALVRLLVDEISERLARNIPVLFLVSGGSTAPIGVEVCNTILERAGTRRTLLKWLFTVSLIDERFGVEGHPDSNWKLLVDSGLITTSMTAIRILHGDDERSDAFRHEIERFNEFLAEAAVRHDGNQLFIAGILGIGSDGHTAGILPDSPVSALPFDGTRYAEGYKAGIFRRITVTPAFFRHFDLATAWVGGEEKRQALLNLALDLPVSNQPAQLLKSAARATIFTDLILEGT